MTVKTLCIGVDVHLDDLVLRAVDQADGHEVLERFRVTNNLPLDSVVRFRLIQAAHTAPQFRPHTILACSAAPSFDDRPGLVKRSQPLFTTRRDRSPFTAPRLRVSLSSVGRPQGQTLLNRSGE